MKRKRKLWILAMGILCVLVCLLTVGCREGKDEDAEASILEFMPVYDGRAYGVRKCLSPDVKEVIIPDTYKGRPVRSILSGAFADCERLRRVSIPSSIVHIAEGAFSGCYPEEIALDAENANYYIKDNCLIERKTEILIASCKVGMIPEGVWRIADGLFTGKKIKELYIPGSVTEIGDRAFANCGIVKLTISEGVRNIGAEAFANCNIQTLVIPNSVDEIGEEAFSNCEKLHTVQFPNSLQALGESAFSGCKLLRQAVLPADLRIIEAHTFSGCTELDKIVLPENLKEIREYAFAETAIQEIMVPKTTVSVVDSAFTGCDDLRTVTINSPGCSSGSFSIEGLHDLLIFQLNREGDGYQLIKAVACTDPVLTIPTYHHSLPVIHIAYRAFAGTGETAHKFVTVKFPHTLETIGDFAFSGCINFVLIAIPEMVTDIGHGAFGGCELISITVSERNSVYRGDGDCLILRSTDTVVFGCGYSVIPDDVKKIGPYAFSGADLTSVCIPDSVTSIGSYAFYDCDGLTSIVLPDSVTSIGENAFNGCRSLVNVNFQGTKAQWDAIHKGYDWDAGIYGYTVHCNDGDIVKS